MVPLGQNPFQINFSWLIIAVMVLNTKVVVLQSHLKYIRIHENVIILIEINFET